MATVKLTYPDGSTREVEAGADGAQALAPLPKKLRERVLAIDVNGVIQNLSQPITTDAIIRAITCDDSEGLRILRHSCSHLMASAVLDLFPETKLTIGPAVEDGFYYDFQRPTPFSSEDLAAIEKRMRELVAARIPFQRQEVPYERALEMMHALDNPFKVEILENEVRQALTGNQPVTLYRHGDFVDLCAGPHVPDTGHLKAFRLTNVAGAYWRGSESNPMLQRIYGTVWETEKDLQAYLERLEQARQRDHRRLGQELDLFSIQDDCGPGLVHWHPRGGRIRAVIEDFWRREHRRRGYELVYIPHIYRREMFRKTGHLDCYADMMYAPMDVDGVEYNIKPMNCPGHILIYKTQLRSYRDLPIRYAELGTVYRYERSGVLHGLLRVRGFTQDDAHIFCTPEQLRDEIIGTIDLMDFMMKSFGFKYKVYLATRPEKAVGSQEIWDLATSYLREALQVRELAYEEDPGGGAFYGPKIDVKLLDALGRYWQGPTIQCDFNLPERLDVTYIDAQGQQQRVIMIHRAVLGSMERFVANLIEHYGGALPAWLAPEQVRVLPISDHFLPYARQVADCLRAADIRVDVDARSEKIGYKIRGAEKDKVPFMFVVGAKEAETNQVALRLHRQGDQGSIALDEAVVRITDECRMPG